MRTVFVAVAAFILGSTVAASASGPEPSCHRTAPGKTVCTIHLPGDTAHTQTRYVIDGKRMLTIDWTRPGLLP